MLPQTYIRTFNVLLINLSQVFLSLFSLFFLFSFSFSFFSFSFSFLSFLPFSLFYSIEETVFCNEKTPPLPTESIYDFVTFGAPAAHIYKFKTGNLRSLFDRFFLFFFYFFSWYFSSHFILKIESENGGKR